MSTVTAGVRAARSASLLPTRATFSWQCAAPLQVEAPSVGLATLSTPPPAVAAAAEIPSAHRPPAQTKQRPPRGASPAGHALSVRTLMDARVHMGHRTRLWHPSMAPYILGSRNGMHIVDLDKTIVMLRRALTVVASMAEDGCSFLWLGPGDPQKQRLVNQAAARAGAYSMEGRWIGGTLTNSIESGQAHKFDYRVPDCVFVIDMLRHAPALNEARTVGVPIVGIADTDCDPGLLTYPIPGNDDGVHAVNIYCHLMRLAIQDGRRRAGTSPPRAPVPAPTRQSL
jgi:small subunit ribosomal protein S2